jgi:hypothetical protein
VGSFPGIFRAHAGVQELSQNTFLVHATVQGVFRVHAKVLEGYSGILLTHATYKCISGTALHHGLQYL